MNGGQDETRFMRLAIEEAKRCQAEDERVHPFVGAVVVRENRVLASAYRGGKVPGDHAEYTALETILENDSVADATVYTTLEPCTTRNPPNIPCANHLIDRQVRRVVIGMLDPDQRITGQGILRLRKAGISIDLFPRALMAEVEDLNRRFIREKERVNKRRTDILSAADGLGLTSMYNMRDARGQSQRNEQTQSAIAAAMEMFLAANSGASYLDARANRHWDVIVRRLKEGIRFRVVLLDPTSNERQLRNRLNGLSSADLDPKLNIGNLIDIHNRYPTLEIRLAPFGMHCTVFMTDKFCFFDPYWFARADERIEGRAFCIQAGALDNPQQGLLPLARSHFDVLWNQAIGLETWHDAHRDRLNAGVPTIVRRRVEQV